MIILSFMAVAASATLSKPHDIFGVTVGQPLPYLECAETTDARFKTNKYYKFMYDLAKVQPCYRRIKNQRSNEPFEAFEGLVLNYPEHLKIVGFGDVYVTVNPNVSWVYLKTGGQVSQEDDLKVLIEKYGAPTKLSRETTQNGFGATFIRISAQWDLGDGVEGNFKGFDRDIKSGQFVISDQVGRNEMSRRGSVNQGRGL